MIEYGKGMLRFTFLANGGAIIAMLTFLGNLDVKKGTPPDMFSPLLVFIIGVVLNGMACVITYFIQFTLLNESINRREGKGLAYHRWWFWITVFLLLGSLAAFGMGAIWAVIKLGK